jgi:alpha-tubulin suppressor-like RCC1 family protein
MGLRVIDMAAGRDFSVFVTEDRDVYACGCNDQGQLGIGDT